MIGNRLKMLREAKGFTMRKVAADFGIPETTYRNYEHDVSEPNLTMLVKISQYYSIDVDWLLGLEKKNSTPQTKWDAIREIIENLPEPEVKELLSYLRYLEWKVEERKRNQN